MADQTDPNGNKAPDPASSYERAQPDKESPSKTLAQPATTPPQQQDELARHAKPASQKKAE
jgi:hypothetical protein